MCVSVSHTEFFSLVTAVPTVVFLVAQQARVDTVAVGTAEPGRHLTGDVHWSNKHKSELVPISEWLKPHTHDYF